MAYRSDFTLDSHGLGQFIAFHSSDNTPAPPLPQSFEGLWLSDSNNDLNNGYFDTSPASSPESVQGTDSAPSTPPADAEDVPTPAPKKAPARRGRPANHVPRPRNAFMIFRSEYWANQKISKNIEVDHRHISRIIGILWNELSEDGKDQFRVKADQEKLEHQRRHPNYRFTPTVRAQKPVKRKVQRNGVKDLRRCRDVAGLLMAGKQGHELEQEVMKLDKGAQAGAHHFIPSDAQPTAHRLITSDAQPTAHHFMPSDAQPTAHYFISSDAQPTVHHLIPSDAQPTVHHLIPSDAQRAAHHLIPSDAQCINHRLTHFPDIRGWSTENGISETVAARNPIPAIPVVSPRFGPATGRLPPQQTFDPSLPTEGLHHSTPAFAPNYSSTLPQDYLNEMNLSPPTQWEESYLFNCDPSPLSPNSVRMALYSHRIMDTSLLGYS